MDDREPSVRLQEPPFALPFDTILSGRYIVERVLGSGGFGITYQGRNLDNDLFVAIKEYYPHGVVTRVPGTTKVAIESSFEQFRIGKEDFLQEARIIHHCDNPHIAKIYSLFEEYGTAYYVMEFLDGQDLMHYLKEKGGKLTWNELSPIIMQVMDALILVHSKGVIHRDVSPENIFLCTDQSAKLIDFGTAVRNHSGQKKMVVLKKGYAPPEQYDSNGKQGKWTDIYALGSTMYRCLTGKIPPEATERLRHDTLVRPSGLGAVLPLQVEEAIMQALNLDVNQRFFSIEAFRNAVRDPIIKNREKSVSDTLSKGIRAVSESLTTILQSWNHKNPILEGLQGIYAGQRFELEKDVTFGRDPNACNVVFPPEAKGVSKVHCRIVLNVSGQRAVLMDCNSTNGTFLNGSPLPAGMSAVLQSGSVISFGGNNAFRFT